MSELAKRSDLTTQVHSAEIVAVGPASLMEVISRAAADPNTDVDKLERLLGMYERITSQQAKADYTAAMAQLQPRLPVIDEKGKTDKTTYAKWEDINDAIRPLLHDHGFALTFRVARNEATVAVTGVLSHQAGHSEETTLDLPVDTGPGRNAVQSVGSSVSYGKRYTATALLNITSRVGGDRDDNGRGADPAFYITEDQRDELQALMEEVKADRAGFLKFMGVSLLKDIPAKQYQKAVTALQAKRSAR